MEARGRRPASLHLARRGVLTNLVEDLDRHPGAFQSGDGAAGELDLHPGIGDEEGPLAACIADIGDLVGEDSQPVDRVAPEDDLDAADLRLPGAALTRAAPTNSSGETSRIAPPPVEVLEEVPLVRLGPIDAARWGRGRS